MPKKEDAQRLEQVPRVSKEWRVGQGPAASSQDRNLGGATFCSASPAEGTGKKQPEITATNQPAQSQDC